MSFLRKYEIMILLTEEFNDSESSLPMAPRSRIASCAADISMEKMPTGSPASQAAMAS